MMCMDGTVMDPRSSCNCITEADYKKIFPDWATQKDIDVSNNLMWDSYKYIDYYPEPEPLPPTPMYEKPSHWEECPLVALCAEPSWFNELACNCFSMLQCHDECAEGKVQDPVSGCGCIPAAEVRAKYPDWATEKDIDYSWRIAWDQYSRTYA